MSDSKSRQSARWLLYLLVVVGLVTGLVVNWPVRSPQLVQVDAGSLIDPWTDVVIDLGQQISVGRRQVSVTPGVEFEQAWSNDGSQVTLSPRGLWAADTVYTVLLPHRAQLSFTTGPAPSVTVFAGGDVMLDMLPGENIAQRGPASVFAGMGGLITSADIAFANLEGPVSRRGAPVAKRYTFCGRPEALSALTAVGVDVVSFANNHAMDYGEDAFLDTLTHLNEAGIGYAGAGEDKEEALTPWVTDVKGLRVALLAFAQRDVLPRWSYDLFGASEDSPGMIFHDEPGGRERVLDAVRQAKQAADIVLVSMHWGYERETRPRSMLRAFGHDIIEAGATAIIGHHPHLPYGVEVYQGKPIIYSLGNFLFHPYVEAQRESYVATLELTADGVAGVALHPILMHDGVTELLLDRAADSLAKAVIDRSAALGTRVERQGNILIVKLP